MFEGQQNCLRQVIGLITYILSLWCVVDIIQLILQKCAFQYKYFLCMKEDFVLCNFPELMLLFLTIWLTCLLLKNIFIYKKVGCYVAIENKIIIWSLLSWMLIVKIRCFYWAMIGKLLNNPQFLDTRLMHFLHLSFRVMLFRHMISKQSTFKLQNLFYHNQTAYCTVISAFIIFFSRYANVIFGF